ncbi:MAG: ECF-type sigma factor [Acidimicrobiales bacterium]|nr:ECF-type sigma factor [Acidimicrobiales bacterium]
MELGEGDVGTRSVGAPSGDESGEIEVSSSCARALERRVAARTRVVEAFDDGSDDVLAIREAIRRLAPRQREAVVLRHFVGLTVDEAADAMKVSPGALRSLTHRATQQLNALLSDSSDEVDHAY